MKNLNKLLRKLIYITFVLSSGYLNAQELSNGQVLKVVNDDVPLEYVQIVFLGGASIVPSKKQGLSTLLAGIFEKGPKGMSEAEYKKNLFLRNSKVYFYSGNRAFTIFLKAPKSQIEAGLLLIKRIVENPKLDSTVFKEVKKKVRTASVASFERMQAYIFHFGADKAFSGHPALRDGDGTPTSYKNVKLSDLEKYWKEQLKFSKANVFSLGSSTKAEIATAINKTILAGVKKTTTKVEKVPNVNWKKFRSGKTVFHKKGAKDNQILWIMPFQVKPYSREYAVAQVALKILGGGSQGRLGKALREERGLTYHAGSYIRRLNKDQCYWMIYTFGKSEFVPKLLKGIPEIFGIFKKTGVTKIELVNAKNEIITTVKKSYELPKDELNYKVRSFLFGFPENGIELFKKNVKEVTLAEVNKFIKTSIDLKKAQKFIMGDKKNISKYLGRPKVFVSDDLL